MPQVDPPITYYAELAARVYNDSPDFGAVKSAARAKLYGGGSILVFRGTDDFEAMLADAAALPFQTDRLGVLHQGFHTAWLEVREPILALKTPPSIIVGHSEGADLAIQAAAEFCLDGRPPSQLLCFEPARLCMDDVIASILAKAGTSPWGSRHAIDPVPWLPSWARLPFTYADIGHFQVEHLDPIWYHLIENVLAALAGSSK